MPHGIAPQLSVVDVAQATYLFDLAMSSLRRKEGNGCGNCRTPFGRSALFCKNDPAPTETRGINRSGDFRAMVGQSDDGNKLGPQTGAEREMGEVK